MAAVWGSAAAGAVGGVGDRRARRLHALELPLAHVGRGARRRVGRRQPHAALPHGLRAVRAAAVADAGRPPRFLGAFADVTAAVGLGSVSARSAHGALEDGRLAAPIGYENASAGLFLAAFWPAVMLAALAGARGRRPRRAAGRRRRPARAARAVPEPRVAARGGRPLVLALGLARERPRLLLALVVVGAGRCRPAVPARRLRRRVGEDALPSAVIAIALSAAALMAAGLVRRACTSRGGRAGRGAMLVVALIAGGLGAGVAARWARASPAARGRAATTSGASPGASSPPIRCTARAPTTSPTTTRASGGGGRSRSTPTASSGGRSGRPGSSARCCSRASSWRPAAAVRRSTADPVTVAALVSAAAWLAHGDDRLAVGAARAGGAGDGVPGDRRLARRRARGAAASRGSDRHDRGRALAAASYALPAVAAREIERAVPAWDADPAAARDRFERARKLNPLTDRADVIEGTLALRDGDVDGRPAAPSGALAPAIRVTGTCGCNSRSWTFAVEGARRRSPGCGAPAAEPERAGDRRRARGGARRRPLPEAGSRRARRARAARAASGRLPAGARARDQLPGSGKGAEA